MPSPSLTGLNAPTFNENTVNATAQVIDSDVTFTDADNDFNGGTLVVSGLLAEDTVSILSGSVISLSAGTVYYDADGVGGAAAVAIGTATGGVGAAFTVTFNAAATSTAIDLLIEALTYANSSNTPTASRDLVLNVTDAAGGDLSGPLAFTQRSGAANPFNGASVGNYSTPTFADLDGDGDLDAVVGEVLGTLLYFENTGTASTPVFVARTGGGNPLSGVDLSYLSNPTFADLDGDGDPDAVVGENSGFLYYFENTGTAQTPAFTQRTGGANPFNGIFGGDRTSPTFADVDGDGDLDAVVGELFGTLLYLENTGTASAPVFVQRTGAANPFSGIDVGMRSKPALADMDGDGDLDLLVGEAYGAAAYYENTGTGLAPVFTQRTGGDNPFDGVDIGARSAPAFADLDGDGDPDVLIGALDGALYYFENTTVRGQILTVNVTAQADAPTASSLPSDVTVTEDVASNLNLSAVTLADVDTAGSITVVLTASAGTMTATTSGGVTVSNSGTGALTLSGTASAIDTFLNTAANIQYTGASNANGDNAATLTVTANDGSGAVSLGVVNIDISPVNDAPTLTGLATSVTLGENTVNVRAQTIDATVVFGDVEGNFNGGHLIISGLLAEDTIAFTDQGSGIGLIRIDASGAVFYEGLQIATSNLPGVTATGATLDITFNANATVASVDALIQDMIYANSSNAPTASRDLTVTLSDAAGASTAQTVTVNVTGENDAPTLTGLSSSVTFLENTVNAAAQIIDSTVVFGDAEANLTGGHLIISGLLAEDTIAFAEQGNDAGQIHIDVMGLVFYGGVHIGSSNLPGVTATGATLDITFNANATIAAVDALIQDMTYANASDMPTASRILSLSLTDSTGEGVGFAQRTGAANPFNGVSVPSRSTPTLVDLDHDGDLDLVVGSYAGTLSYYENTGTASIPVMVQRTGSANPFNGVDLGDSTFATFGDLDHDGDLDMVSGEQTGILNYFENTGTALAPVFVERTAGASPFSGFDVGQYSTPALADLDGDGDLDLMAGAYDGTFRYFQNTGTNAAPTFVARTGASNPLNGVDLNYLSQPTFKDVDADGDLDMVAGMDDGTIHFFENTGTALAPVFVERTGAANPYQGIDLGIIGAPAVGDIDGDGDLDLLIGGNPGAVGLLSNVQFDPVRITIIVTPEADAIVGGGTADSLAGTTGADIMDGGGGDDVLDGGTGNDTLVGGLGNDYLRGGSGSDTMQGGAGDDTYVVTDAGDTADETGGDGTDLVITSQAWTLGTGFENLTLAAPGGAVSGTGNGLDNVILGNSFANVLSGLDGNDTLFGDGGADTLNGGDGADSLDGGGQNDALNGGAGVDTLSGGIGNDALDGGTEADAMTGGAGNDSYVVDDAGDLVTELAAGGTDTVSASVSHSLTDNVEALTLTGLGDIAGTGNALRNTITGNSGANVLHGGAEIDTLNGGDGADTLYGDAGGDVLSGQDGDDILFGGAGEDSLTGGAGADTFAFNDLDVRRSGLGLSAERDKVLDLSFAAGDRIDLSAIDANVSLAGDQAFTFVSKFTKLAGQAVLSLSGGVTTLQLDVDGDGRADLMISINGDVTGTTANLYTGGGDVNGGWVL